MSPQFRHDPLGIYQRSQRENVERRRKSNGMAWRPPSSGTPTSRRGLGGATGSWPRPSKVSGVVLLYLASGDPRNSRQFDCSGYPVKSRARRVDSRFLPPPVIAFRSASVDAGTKRASLSRKRLDAFWRRSSATPFCISINHTQASRQSVCNDGERRCYMAAPPPINAAQFVGARRNRRRRAQCVPGAEQVSPVPTASPRPPSKLEPHLVRGKEGEFRHFGAASPADRQLSGMDCSPRVPGSAATAHEGVADFKAKVACRAERWRQVLTAVNLLGRLVSAVVPLSRTSWQLSENRISSTVESGQRSSIQPRMSSHRAYPLAFRPGMVRSTVSSGSVWSRPSLGCGTARRRTGGDAEHADLASTASPANVRRPAAARTTKDGSGPVLVRSPESQPSAWLSIAALPLNTPAP